MALHPKRKGTPGKFSIPSAEIVANMLRDGLIVDAKVTNMSVSKLTAGNLAVQILFTVGGSVATAASGARVDIVPTGIKVYDSNGTQRGQILSDGSGWFGSSSDFLWTTAGAVSINGAKIQTLTVGTLQINDTAVNNAKIATTYALGDSLLWSNDAATGNQLLAYTMEKQIYLPFAGSLRIKFDLKSESAGTTVYGQIYRTRATVTTAVGTSQSTTSGTYVTFSEDITSWQIGDFVELHLKTSDVGIASQACNFRIYVSYSSLIEPINTLV